MKELGPYILGPNGTAENGIYTGDAQELARAIPDGSVDLIFTDPPYHPEFMYLYEFLARLSSRVLRAGGLLFTLSGIYQLNELYPMFDKHLDYYWTISGFRPESNLIFNKRNMGCRWRAILVYRKGLDGRLPFLTDGMYLKRDKRYHEWGHGEDLPKWYIARLGPSVVLDPFAGGGTVPVVCKVLGCQYLAFEINPDTAEAARERVRNTEFPLFEPEPEQLELVGLG